MELTYHADYTKYAPQWRRCRDTISGSDAVKAAGSSYLPRPAGMDAEEYAAYKFRAVWYGATARTLAAMFGALFRKPPQVVNGEVFGAALETIGNGNPRTDIETVCRGLAYQVISTGRSGILADVVDDLVTLTIYPAESILDWSDDWVLVDLGGEKYSRLAMVDGKYTAEVYARTSSGIELVSSSEPRRMGRPLDEIPFVWCGSESITSEVDRPPLIDLADLNLSHYRSSADLEHARHWTALPTLVLAGWPEDAVVRFGSSTALVSRDPNAKAAIVAGESANCSALRDALADKEAAMAAMGSRMLEPQKRAAETAEAMEIRQSGEVSILKSISRSCSLAMTRALQFAGEFAGVATDGVSVEINTEFYEPRADAQVIGAVLSLWQAGLVARRTAYGILERMGLSRVGVNWEDELREMALDEPGGVVPGSDVMASEPMPGVLDAPGVGDAAREATV